MSPSVVFTPEAEDQLAELYRYIAAAGSPEVAARTRRRSSLTARSWPHSRIAAARATTSGLDCAQSASGDGSLLHSLCWTRPWRSSVSSTAGAITRRF